MGLITTRRLTPVAAAVLALAMWSGGERAARPGAAAFDQGTRAYRAARHDAAAGAFAAAARALTREADRARALHNLGNALAQAGRPVEALDAYRAALRLGDREATQRNYEIVRARVPRRPVQGPSHRGGDDDERLFEAARRLERPRAVHRAQARRWTADW